MNPFYKLFYILTAVIAGIIGLLAMLCSDILDLIRWPFEWLKIFMYKIQIEIFKIAKYESENRKR